MACSRGRAGSGTSRLRTGHRPAGPRQKGVANELRKRRLEPSPAGVRWWVVVAAAWVGDVQERLKTLEAKAAQDGQSLVDRLLDRDDHNKVCYHHATSPEKSVSSRSFLLSPTRAGPD